MVSQNKCWRPCHTQQYPKTIITLNPKAPHSDRRPQTCFTRQTPMSLTAAATQRWPLLSWLILLFSLWLEESIEKKAISWAEQQPEQFTDNYKVPILMVSTWALDKIVILITICMCNSIWKHYLKFSPALSLYFCCLASLTL